MLKAKELDFQDVLNGIKEASENIPSKISEEEAYALALSVEKETFQELSDANLKQSEAYLKDIAKENGVISVVPEKVYIKVIEEGTGEELSAEGSGWFKLKACWLNEKPFYENDEGIMQSLDTAIEGFSKGAAGMKVGEKRMIYIHPEYGYRIHMSRPNCVIIVEAQRIKQP